MAHFVTLVKNFGKNRNIHLTLFLLQWATLPSLGKYSSPVRNNTFRPKRTLQTPLTIQMVPFLSPYITRTLTYLPKVGLMSAHRTYAKYDVETSLFFIYYKNGHVLSQHVPGIGLLDPSYLYVTNSCLNEKISFIFHGWSESCYTDWIAQLEERLTFHRGGCVVCVDYSRWSKKSYIELLQHFDTISEILYEEILQLIKIGFKPSNIFMFGFSYGGQIASKIGRLLKSQYNIKKIDICDLAGPGFDFLTRLNHSEAAENVQCYYSSLDKGTHFHSCHQNIRLGQCGYSQPAILSQPYFSSHGLCLRIYINAFDFKFYATQKYPRWCERGKTITNLPHGFTVGYSEDNYKNMTGDIFVPTALNYPYNLSKKEIALYEKHVDDP